MQGQRRALEEGHRVAVKLQEEKEKLEGDLHRCEPLILQWLRLAWQQRRGERSCDERKLFASLEALIQEREAILSRIYSSHGWKALTVYYQLRNKLLPEGTKRREIAKAFWRFLRGKFLPSHPAEKNGRIKALGR